MHDFLGLLQRDHHDLECGLDELLEAVTVQQLRSALDGVRLGLTAHAEAEDIVLAQALRRAEIAELDAIVGESRAAHLNQEGALASLVVTRPNTPIWRDRARHLRDLVRTHSRDEEQRVVPAIRRLAPNVYQSLAGLFATERLRQLAMLQPSAPIFVPELAAAG